MNLKTTFIGLELKSPVIAGSCGLTADIDKLQEIANQGAGAVILKSLFEEQINREAAECISGDSYPEEADYIQNYVRAHTVQHYIDLVKQAKAKLDIPVIASVNCLRDGEWLALLPIGTSWCGRFRIEIFLFCRLMNLWRVRKLKICILIL